LARNDQSPALHPVIRNREIQNVIDRVKDSLNAAAMGDVDHRIHRCGENAPRTDRVGTSEHNDAVPIGDRIGLVEYLNSFSMD